MQKIHFSIIIHAPREKVWDVMLSEATYKEWTKAFNPGSYFKGDWSKGSKMLFLGPNPETGEEGGMVSEIADSRPYEFISIRHLGIVNKGVEDTTSEEAKKWAPAYENYTFRETDGGTEVVVDMDSEDSFVESFNTMWPEALKLLKEIAERPS